MLSGFGPADERQPLQSALVQNARWTVKLRWLAGTVIIVGTVAGRGLGVTYETAALLVIGLTVLGYNSLMSLPLTPEKARKLTFERARRLWLIQILADVLTLTMIVYFTGGVESPVAIFYVFHVVCAGILLPAWLGYVVAGLASIMFGLVAVVQAAFPAIYHPLAFTFAGQYYYRWSFVGLALLAFAAAMGTSVSVTVVIRKRLQRTEEQIIRTRNVLDSIISSMSEALIFLSPRGKLLLANPTATKWFSIAANHDPASAGAELSLPEAIKAYVEQEQNGDRLSGTRTFQFQCAITPSEEVREFRSYASRVFDDSGRHLGHVIVAEDITEQQQLEQDLRTRNREIQAMSNELQRNQKEMAQREKMVAVGTMAAGVAHEIGNPLACLSAVVQLLRRKQSSDADQHHLQTLQEQIDRIARIVRQVLEFARPASSEFAPVDLDDLVEQSLAILHYSERGRRAKINSIRRTDLPLVRIMPQQFQQVLVNLILNALDAVENSRGQRLVSIERTAQDGWVNVIVKDTGCGMSKEQIQKAFEPFFTTKPPGKGTGLGLAVCYRLVQNQGGQIRIDSTLGEGTVVTVSFRAHHPGGAADSTARGDGNDWPTLGES